MAEPDMWCKITYFARGSKVCRLMGLSALSKCPSTFLPGMIPLDG